MVEVAQSTSRSGQLTVSGAFPPSALPLTLSAKGLQPSKPRECDNLKAAVTNPDRYDPGINRKRGVSPTLRRRLIW
jgi:hypothetical protein